MATEVLRKSFNNVDADGILDEGIQPGLSRESLLVISGSYDDLTNCVIAESVRGVRVDNGDNSSSRPDVINRTLTSIQDLEGKIIDSSEDSANEEGKSLDKSATVEKLRRKSSADGVEYVQSPEWKQHRKHIFIISSSGKPVFSRYGDEDRLVSLMGVMQALVAFVQDSEGKGMNNMQCIVAGDHRCVFFVREHLTLVAVSRTRESTQQLVLQLIYLYNQILSILTLSRINHVFQQRRNYDLRRLLTGADRFLNNLLQLIDTDPSFLLGAVKCLPLDYSVRDTIIQTMLQHAKVKDVVLAILITDCQLVSIVKMKKFVVHNLDLHLIFNLVSASESFKTAESWTPVCLPKFDPNGYFQAYVSYLDSACHTCLLLLTDDRESEKFHVLSNCRQAIQERLERHNCLVAIEKSRILGGYRMSDTEVTEVRHFLYKSRSVHQFTSPLFSAPYHTAEEQQRLLGLYQYLHVHMHGSSHPLKMLFHIGDHEALLGYVSSNFELYSVFSPLITKSAAINAVNQLLKWIKKEEDKLFILGSPTF